QYRPASKTSVWAAEVQIHLAETPDITDRHATYMHSGISLGRATFWERLRLASLQAKQRLSYPHVPPPHRRPPYILGPGSRLRPRRGGPARSPGARGGSGAVAGAGGPGGDGVPGAAGGGARRSVQGPPGGAERAVRGSPVSPSL